MRIKLKIPELYYFSNEELKYTKVKLITLLVPFIVFVMFFTLLPTILMSHMDKETQYESMDNFESEMIVINVKDTLNDFSEERLIDLLKTLNIKFPYIVLAQSKLETGNYQSKIFKENHNLFGMKEARVRVHTAKGTQSNHAYYDNWRESVYDYAFYQSRYLSKVRTEREYYAYLNQSYAEAPNYVNTLTNMVKNEKLKEMFF